MTLKATLDSLEGVDAAIQPLYQKNSDGKFYLAVEGMVASSKLDEFRTNNIQLKQQMEQFKDIDPKKYRELVDQFNKLNEKKLIDAGEVDKVVEQRVTALRTEMETTIENLNKGNASLSNRLASVLIDSTVKSAAIAVGAVPTAVDDVVLRAKSMFSLKDGEVVAMNDKGQIIYGKDGTTPLGIDEWVKTLKTQAPHLFVGMSGGGAGGSGHGGKDTSKMSATEKIATGLEAR